jgi:hypothetical protein
MGGRNQLAATAATGSNVVGVQEKQVKYVVDEWGMDALLERILECLKTCPAVFILDYDFTIEYRGFHG